MLLRTVPRLSQHTQSADETNRGKAFGRDEIRSFAGNEMDVLDAAPWGTDWAWSLPLILINVIIHVFGLAFIFDAFTFLLREIKVRRRFMIRFAEVMSVAVVLIVVLHGIEATTWALAYLALGVLPTSKIAMLYSVSAMTGFGAGNISLPAHWQMMGVLQSLAGVLLFGLTTAFMFAMFQAVWPSQQRPQTKTDQDPTTS